MKYRSDQDILIGCLNGDRKSQEELYNKYAARMMAVCMRYTKSKEEAEDIFHEAFVKVFNHLNDFKLQNSFEGWIRRVMVNTAINHFHKNKAMKIVDDIDNHHNTFAEAPEILGSLQNDELMQMISSLPTGYRMVFNMAVIEGYQHKEIAELLKINEGTSKSQLAKAKALLKRMIEKKMAVAVPSER
jgi:RNA polymerase sigma-70 factor (ECF subfamily)